MNKFNTLEDAADALATKLEETRDVRHALTELGCTDAKGEQLLRQEFKRIYLATLEEYVANEEWAHEIEDGEDDNEDEITPID